MERTATAPVAVRVSVVAVEEGGASSMSISVDMVRLESQVWKVRGMIGFRGID